MHAAVSGNRVGEASRVKFALMMAVFGCGLQEALNMVWPKLLEAVGGHFAWAVFIMAGIGPAVVYWAHSLLLGWRSGWNGGSLELKLQPKGGPTPENYFAGAPLVLLNTLVVGPMLTFAAVPAWNYTWGLRGFSSEEERLSTYPTSLELLLSLVVFLLVEEVGFYYSHRLAHHKWLYGWIHKIHHEYKAPVAYTAVYAHPLEHLLVNVAPVIAGPALLGSHPTTATTWIVLALLYTTNSHCGYFFSPYGSPEGHDWHHEKFDEFFGVLGLLDSLHGTDKRYREEQARRNAVQAAGGKAEGKAAGKADGKAD